MTGYRTFQVRLLALQVADGGLKLRVFAMTRVNVCFTVSPEKKTAFELRRHVHADRCARGSGLGSKLIYLPFGGDTEVWGGEIVQPCRRQSFTIRRHQYLCCKALWENLPSSTDTFPMKTSFP